MLQNQNEHKNYFRKQKIKKPVGNVRTIYLPSKVAAKTTYSIQPKMQK